MKESEIKKVCNFFVNDWHLTAIILPHINRMINKNEKVETIFEKGIKNNIKEILSKMNLKAETQNKILKINWNKTAKYIKIKEQLEETIKNGQAINIIISGSKEYIEKANEELEKIAKDMNKNQLTIINCYQITEKEEMNNILKKYKYELNTLGIKEIEQEKKKICSI